MARLQILELPEGSGDDRPPFVLVVDQCIPQRIALGADAPYRDYWQDLAQQIGARGVIVTPETVDIPANDTTAYLGGSGGQTSVDADAQPSNGPRCRYCGADCSDGRSYDGGELYTCPACSDWRATLNQHKTAITDALGIDRLRDWDDIRNAAAGLKRERDTQAEALERVRQESTRIRATTRTWEPVADLIDAALNGKQSEADA